MKMEALTITTKAKAALEDLNKEFGSLYTRRDAEHKLAALKEAEGMSDYPEVLSELMKIMDAFNMKYEKRMDDAAYYAKLLKNAPIPTYDEVRDKMVYTILKKTKYYASPEEYMKRIVDRMEDPEDGWKDDTLRLRILKQFIKYGNYLQDVCHKGSNGNVVRDIGGRMQIVGYVREKTGKRTVTLEDVLNELDDGVFGLMDNAPREQLRPRGMFGLLKIVNDLAKGLFRTEGSTKRALYFFAMVYGMTYYAGNERDPEVYDARTDIEDNLFRDYYVNNLMRYISAAYRSDISKYEADPSGQGINYKNFAEMVYLYYIRKRISPQEKIRLSSLMIDELTDKSTQAGTQSGGTRQFRSRVLVVSEDGQTDVGTVLNLSEKEFKEFILKYYDTHTTVQMVNAKGKTVSTAISPVTIGLDQNTAYEVYTGILKELREDYKMTPADCIYGLQFVEIKELRDLSEQFLARHTDVTKQELDDYIGLLESVNRFIVKQSGVDPETGRELEDSSALSVKKPEDVTRTSIITAYYYLYNAMIEQEYGEWKNFKELFDDFSFSVNKHLEEAYYQPVSVKNIFDIMLIFSSYAYMNL
ncbi:MAG: hypothetical protein IKG46_12700 [Solobacterium sp.]|nr:hypothetical protein [Solobacterium sp.]